MAAVATFVGTSITAVMAAGYSSLPNADALVSAPLPSDTLVYDRSGQVLLADLHQPGYQHYQETLSQMGPYLPAATVAIEDANFWNEPGVDPSSIARAAVADVMAGRVVEGGSTITQQLVKRQIVGDDESFARKFREAALAMRVSDDFSKSQILSMYLNAIFYGNNAYGAEAAARIYFHKDASQLDLAQSAMLAGLPQDPSLLNPVKNFAGAKARQQQVLQAMAHTHAITQEEAVQAQAEDLSPPAHVFSAQTVDLVPGFASYVQNELAASVGSGVATGGGLTVITTLDWNLQQLAQQSITGATSSNAWRHVSDGALVSMDPRTGQILALVGSAGASQYDMAVGPPRNPGSSFKIFTYAAAIDSRKYTMVTPVVDAPLTVRLPGAAPYQPKNYDLSYHGVCQVQQCLGNSLNVPAVEVEMGTGVTAVVDMARHLGAPPFQQHSGKYTSDDPDTSFGPSLTLGGYGETPLQMATGASALADGGVLHDPVGILRVMSGSRQLFAPDSNGHQVVDAGTAYIVSQMLSNAANRAMVFGSDTPLSLDGRHAAAKTGTTDNFTDAWTVGYTPSLATAIWMGNTNYSPMVNGSDGMFVAAPAWHQFMTGALNAMNKGDEWYQMPSDVTQQWTNAGQQAWFLQGTSRDQAPPPLPGTVQVAGGSQPSGGNDNGNGTCRTWSYQGRSYWSCSPGNSGLPGDPVGGGNGGGGGGNNGGGGNG